MNILFCNTSNVSDIKGGTERITARISKGLTEKGHRCFLAYKTEIDVSLPITKFVASVNVTKESLEDFILVNEINAIIVQKMTRDVKKMYAIREKHGLKFKILTVLHFNPGYEELSSTFKSFYTGLAHFSCISEYVKDVIRTSVYPLYKLFYPLRNKELYRTVYRYSDKVILLSDSFIQKYIDYAKLKDLSKFYVIPNALSYSDFLKNENLNKKSKQVLIVSRMEETPKRISIALKVWKSIEEDEAFADWNMVIVGMGKDLEDYKRLQASLNLRRVDFVGRQQPQEYYEQSRIFLMTSAYEGWGLTLTEAQQFGCVPIAFDTYASLRDIVTDGENGIVVPEAEMELYVRKLKGLMSDDFVWTNMAKNAIQSSVRFSIEHVINLWENLLNS